jgi:hypothetical protein
LQHDGDAVNETGHRRQPSQGDYREGGVRYFATSLEAF